MFALTEISGEQAASSGTNGDIQTPDPTGHLGDESASESLGDPARGLESRGVSSVLSSAASEGGGGGLGGVEFSRPGSETYLTASDDSSSLFDDDMQRAERPRFSLLGSSDGPLGGCKEEEEEGGKLEDYTSEELNKRFQSQRLDSSSSSSEPNTPSPILTPALTPKRPNLPQDPRDNPASPKQPRLRTPAGFGLMNVALAKKHLSQPPISSEAAHGHTRNALSMLRPLRPQETDLDQEQEVGMETGRDTPGPPESEVIREQDGDSSVPPTPPLHRLPSWVRSSKAYFPQHAKKHEPTLTYSMYMQTHFI